MPKIGVFWYYKNTVLGRAVSLDLAEDHGIGVLDSPDTHTELWDNDHSLIRGFSELRECEYFSIPRGRVLWEIDTSSTKIFMDSLLFESSIKYEILLFFGLQKEQVKWQRDDHYTTDLTDLAALFDG